MDLKKALKKLVELAKNQLRYQILITLLGFGAAICAAFIPFLLKRLFENLESMKSEKVIYTIFFIFICYSFSILLELIGGLISNVAEKRAGAFLKKKLLFKAIHLPWKYYQTHGKGEVLSKGLSDTEQLGRNISFIPALIIEFLSLIIASFTLFKLNTLIGIIVLTTIPIYFFSMRCFISNLRDTSKVEREKYATSVELFRDILEGLQEIRLFNATSHFEGKLEKNLKNWIESVRSSAFYQTLNYGIQSYLSTLFPLVVLGIGAILINKGLTSIGVVVASFSYIGRLYRPIERLAYLWSVLVRSIPIMERVYGLLDYMSVNNSKGLKPSCNQIEFKDIQWCYNENEVLNGVNFKINSNEKIAIVGQSGAGKSTIAWLLLGLFHPQKGQILIDGNSIYDYDPDELIKQIGYASAHPHIFQGTLKENITLGLDIPDDEVKFILNVCGLSEMDLKKMIGEGSGDLSLGQKQRIGLARVIIRKPKIIILDEATSGIDSQLEEKILEVIFNLNSIVIIMSHRLSTVKHCPQVNLLWNGIITETGTHQELINLNKNYRWIFQDQLNSLKTS